MLLCARTSNPSWSGFGPFLRADAGRVTGVIPDRDICVAIATRGRSADRIAVREVAQGHAYTCVPDDDATVALQTMKAHKIRRLPVVDADGHVRGMLSLNDVVTHAGAATPAEVVSTLASICEHRRRQARARPRAPRGRRGARRRRRSARRGRALPVERAADVAGQRADAAAAIWRALAPPASTPSCSPSTSS